MITGFNHNIKYKELIFHIQTEDTGEPSAQIVSHLFIGGNIIISIRNSYKNVINAPTMREVVKNMMKLQHKSVLKNLLSSNYDKEISKMLSFLPSNEKLGKQEEDITIDFLSQIENNNFARLVEDKQKTIIEKNKKSKDIDMDDLILSFLEQQL